MASSKLLLRTLTAILLSATIVAGDAFDDLWTKYMQQTESASKSYESTISRRERNLDHWDVPTAAAYLGLHPETLEPLPQHVSETSSSATATTDGANGVSGSAVENNHHQLADEYVGHDAAILFYAQWCRNCHAVAPSWDAIATHVNAGTKSANLVMALFDCENTAKHTELCAAAGISAYPTLMFVGSGEYHDTDFVTRSLVGKDKSAGPFGATTLRRTVKFQGNWQYGDQILDWVNIMRGLSSWHGFTESGPLVSLRNGLFKLITGGKYKGGTKGRGGKGMMGREGSLPVGVPPNFQTELRGTGGASGGGAGSVSSAESAANAAAMKVLEMELNATKKEKELYEKAVAHSGHLMDGLLLPKKAKEDDEASDRDPFAVLTRSDGWYSNATSLPDPAATRNDEHPGILRSCVLELALDYCARITSRATNDYLDVLGRIPEADPFPSLEEIESTLMDNIKEEEPYCAAVESCALGNFEGPECRPEKCPFENDAACRYVESCFDPLIQAEYGVALGLLKEGERVMDQDWSADGGSLVTKGSGSGATAAAAGETAASGGSAATEGSASAGVGGWGVPVA